MIGDGTTQETAAGIAEGVGNEVVEAGTAVSPWGVWGAVDYSEVASTADEGKLEWEATVLTGLLGADRRLSDKVLAGAAFAWSNSAFDYHTRPDGGLLEGKGNGRVQLLSINPYMGWQLESGNSVWANVGYGWGSLTVDDEAGKEEARTDLRQWSVGGGVSGVLYESHRSDQEVEGDEGSREDDEGTSEAAAATSQLLWRTEAWLSSLHIAGNEVFQDDQQQAWRLRLGLEGNRRINLANAARLTPSLGLFYRYEGGDGTTGSGLDLAAGLRYDATPGLRLEGRGRTLLLHSDGLKDWGISGLVRYAPRGSDGWSISLSPQWGRPEAGGVEQLWQNTMQSRDSAVLVPPEATIASLQLDGELRYGSLPLGRYQLSPAIGFNVSPHRWTTRASATLQLNTAFSLDLELSRHDPAEGETDHAVGLNVELEF